MDSTSKARADLVPYTPDYAGQVRSWIDCEETYDLVCRGVDFPPPDDVVDSWQRKGVRSYLLFSHSRPVAYGELWERKAEQAVEVAHLLVEPAKRGEGYGTRLLELIFDRGGSLSWVRKVLINLYHQSPEALGCYLKAGFDLIGTSTHIEGLRMMRKVDRTTKNQSHRGFK